MKLATDFHADLIGEDVFIAGNATVLGLVRIGSGSNIWFQAVIRGDSERIDIGSNSNIQDGCVLHADPGAPCIVGDSVTVGHAAIIHGATIKDNVMIGMRSVIMNGAVIGEGSIVGAGAVVTEGVEIPKNSMVLGMPAKVIRETTDAERHWIEMAAQHYVEAGKQFSLANSDSTNS